MHAQLKIETSRGYPSAGANFALGSLSSRGTAVQQLADVRYPATPILRYPDTHDPDHPITRSPDHTIPLTLYVSDLHIGRGTPAQSRAAEDDFAALLDYHRAELAGGALVLVGDVFDQYIEYRHLVPKQAVRVLAELGRLVDEGCSVTYVVGNRDPWHVDFLEQDLGVRLVRESTTEEAAWGRTYIAHGDGHVPAERKYNRLRPLLRSPFMARLYRMGLPGDSAFAFARWFAQRFGTDGVPKPSITAALRERAATVLRAGSAELVVLGHGHAGECIRIGSGAYLNPGYWFADRTFGRVDSGVPSLLRWRAGRAEPIATLAAVSPGA